MSRFTMMADTEFEQIEFVSGGVIVAKGHLVFCEISKMVFAKVF